MRAPRTVLAVLATALTAAALSGCTADAPTEPAPPLDGALAAYTALRDDALAALRSGPDAPELAWAESGTAVYPSVQEQDDGACVLFVTGADGAGTIDDASATLTTLAAALGPVVEEHGFEPLSEVQSSDMNGDLWVGSSDPTGWGVELRGGGQSSPEAPDAVVELSISGPVTTDTCDDATLAEAVTEAG